MNYCNARSQNVHIVNGISRHIKPLIDGQSTFSCNVTKPVICKSSN